MLESALIAIAAVLFVGINSLAKELRSFRDEEKARESARVTEKASYFKQLLNELWKHRQNP